MKILILSDDFPPRGKSSAGTIAANLAAEYAKRGHDVHVITSHRTEESPHIIREGNVISLPISYRVSLRHWLALYHPAVSKILTQEIGAIRPDVVHAHAVHLYLSYDSLRIAHRFAKKVFLTAHDVMPFSYGRLKTPRFLNSGGTDYSIGVRDHLRTAGLQYNPVRNLWIRYILNKYVTGVCAVSGSLKNALEFHGIPRVSVVWNGIDPATWRVSDDERDQIRERLGLRGRRVLLFGGRLGSDKGAYPLLSALEHVRKFVPNVALLVIGDPNKWTGLLESSNTDDATKKLCTCIGWVERGDLPRIYAAADVVTVPSLCLDCLPTMALEAAAAAKPVVGTIFGGTAEIVKNGETGIILDPRKIESYANALITLLGDEAHAKSMGEAGRRRIEEFFTVERQAEKYLEFFSS